jgi:hypothetical protein
MGASRKNAKKKMRRRAHAAKGKKVRQQQQAAELSQGQVNQRQAGRQS